MQRSCALQLVQTQTTVPAAAMGMQELTDAELDAVSGGATLGESMLAGATAGGVYGAISMGVVGAVVGVIGGGFGGAIGFVATKLR